MFQSIKSFTCFMKSKSQDIKDFDINLFKSYFDKNRDVFADLCEIWLWFPADSQMLGWNKDRGNKHFIDRPELKMYILYLRESENIIKKLAEVVKVLVEIEELCREAQAIVIQKKEKVIPNGLRTHLLMKLKS